MRTRNETEDIIIPELEQLMKDCTGTYAHPSSWSRKQEAILRRYYGRVPTKKLAEHLGKSYAGTKWKAATMGLKFAPHTPSECEME